MGKVQEPAIPKHRESCRQGRRRAWLSRDLELKRKVYRPESVLEHHDREDDKTQNKKDFE